MTLDCVDPFECISDRILNNPYAVVILRILAFGMSTIIVLGTLLLLYHFLGRLPN